MRFFLSIGAILAAISVAGGAFASHALKGKLDDRALAVFETGARYQMYHAIALVLVALFISRTEFADPLLTASGIAFIVGIVLFSGSLYALSLSGVKWLGAVAPLGGTAFIVGWVCLAISAWRLKL
ncbi:DUF423 domain-containing protein [Leptolyngbya sp. FACHB-17]|uniref:DUF423 domain-containing protein n=1 Tax=unclassified Leptolyngbya TaxID=2650499 RepID=UPI0016809E4A|nr:DUF423 domain-containing protein [Leptolyngbya sp. FACHB-17]MBD2082591.1 DUF423 domain-containing protein [Leptolyngbya sp. FACHB-17]